MRYSVLLNDGEKFELSQGGECLPGDLFITAYREHLRLYWWHLRYTCPSNLALEKLGQVALTDVELARMLMIQLPAWPPQTTSSPA